MQRRTENFANMILITGANGQLGQSFHALAVQHPERPCFFTSTAELDITNRGAVADFFKRHPVSQVVNCAAYTAVDKAESEPEKAALVNIAGVKHLAGACEKLQIPLVHFSTDYVYHGRQNTPLVETDRVSPKGVYARTKLLGERAALKACPGTMVIRTSWVYSAYGQNFVKTMLRLGRERAALNVVFDQIGTPTYAPDLASAVWQVLGKVDQKEINAAAIAGVWHFSNEGAISWFDFAQAIFEMRGISCKVHPIRTKDFPTPAGRPPFSLLDKAKIKTAFGLEIPYWRESLGRCLDLID
jgi:dTDP-4-dehydrorhamnose reductase